MRIIQANSQLESSPEYQTVIRKWGFKFNTQITLKWGLSVLGHCAVNVGEYSNPPPPALVVSELTISRRVGFLLPFVVTGF